MKWIKASERLPEETNGYAKDIVYKIHRDSGIRLFTSTVNQFLDTVKYRIQDRFEWLDESTPPVEEGSSVEGLTVKKFMLKQFPTNEYMDCPVPQHHWETIQEYATEYASQQTAKYREALERIANHPEDAENRFPKITVAAFKSIANEALKQ